MKPSHSFCLLLAGIVVAAPNAKKCSQKDSIIRLFTDPDNLPLAEPFCRHFLGWDTPIVTSESATGTYTYTPTETVVSTATITVAPGAAWARGLTTAAPDHLPTPAVVPRNVPAPVLSAKVSSACYCIESAAHKTRETTTSTIYSTTVRATSTCTQTSTATAYVTSTLAPGIQPSTGTGAAVPASVTSGTTEPTNAGSTGNGSTGGSLGSDGSSSNSNSSNGSFGIGSTDPSTGSPSTGLSSGSTSGSSSGSGLANGGSATATGSSSGPNSNVGSGSGSTSTGFGGSSNGSFTGGSNSSSGGEAIDGSGSGGTPSGGNSNSGAVPSGISSSSQGSAPASSTGYPSASSVASISGGFVSGTFTTSATAGPSLTTSAIGATTSLSSSAGNNGPTSISLTSAASTSAASSITSVTSTSTGAQPTFTAVRLTVARKKRQTADVGYAYVDAGFVKYSSTIDAKDAAALSISGGSLLVNGEYYTFATATDVGTTLSALWSIAETVETGDISTTFTLDGSLGWTNEAAFTGPATLCVDVSGETRNIYWKFSSEAELICDEVTTELVVVHADGTVTLASDTTTSSTGATSTSASVSSSSSTVASTTTSSAAGATFTAAQIKISGSRNRKRQTTTSGYAYLDGDSVKFSSTIAATDAAPLIVDANGALVVGGTSYTYATTTDISTTLSAPWRVIATLDNTLVSTTFSTTGGSLSWTNTDAFTGPATLCMDASGDTRNLYWKFATTATQVCVDVTATLVIVHPDGSVTSIATSTSTSTSTSATPTPTAVAPGTPVLDGGYLQYKGVVYPVTDASSSSTVPTTLASCAAWCSSADLCEVALFVSSVCYSLPSLPTTAATAAYSAADGYAVPASSLSTYKSFTIYPHIVPKVSYSSWTYFGNMGGTYSADFTGCMDMCYDSSSCVGAQVDENYCYIYNNADTTSLSYLAVSNFALRPRPVTPSAPVISGGFVQYGGLVYSTAGSSASSSTPTDLASCAQWCASTGSCATAVYDGGVCYSLSSVPSGSPAPTSSSANGYAVATSTLPTYKTFTVYSNMILGTKSTQNENFPLTSLSSPYTQDFNGCMDYCLSRDWLPCVAVQLVSSRCYIYTSTNTADDLSVSNGAKLALAPAYVSASKPTISGGIYTQIGLVYPTDSAYAQSSAGSVDQCAQLCVADGGCAAVTYNAGVCYSFSALPTASAQKTAVSTDGYAVKVSALTTESGFIEYPNASLGAVTGNIASAPASSLTPPNTVTGCANWASQNSWQGVDSAVSGGTCYLFSGRTRDDLVATIGSYALFKV